MIDPYWKPGVIHKAHGEEIELRADGVLSITMTTLMRKNEKYTVATHGRRRIVTTQAYKDHLKRFARHFPRPIFPEGMIEVKHYTYYKYRSALDERWRGAAMIDVDACLSSSLDMLGLKEGSGIIADDTQIDTVIAKKFARLSYDSDPDRTNKIILLIRDL